MIPGLGRTFVSVGLVKVAAVPFALLSSIILARLLNTEGYGQYAFLMAIIPIASLPIYGGLDNWATRRAASSLESGKFSELTAQIVYIFARIFVLSAALLSLLFLLYRLRSLADWDYKFSVAAIAVAIMALSGCIAALAGLLRGLKKPLAATITPTIFQPALFIFLIASFALSGPLVVEEALISQLISSFLILILILIILVRAKAQHQGNGIHIPPVTSWTLESVPFAFIATVHVLNSNIGLIFLGFLSTSDQVAALRVAMNSALLVSMPLAIANAIIPPFVLEAWRAKDFKKLQHLTTKTSIWTFLASLSLGLLFLVFGRTLIALAFGAEYSEISFIPFVILVIATLVSVFVGSVGQTLVMCNFERRALTAQWVGLIINVGVTGVLIGKFGAMGAAIGAAAGITFWNLLAAIFVYFSVGIVPGAIPRSSRLSSN